MNFALPLTVLALFCASACAIPSRERVTAKQIQDTSLQRGTYSTVPFDTTIEMLPANFVGHSVTTIFQKLAPPRPKGEYEKTQEYEARIAKWETQSAIGKIAPQDKLAFEISQELDSLTVTYNADRELLTASILFESHTFNSRETGWLETSYRSKQNSNRAAVTRMGVRFVISSQSESSIGLMTERRHKAISITKSLSRDDAIRTKRSLTAYAVVTLEEPYKVNESLQSVASLDRPNELHSTYMGLYVRLREVWFVNEKTGEIFGKVVAPFESCPSYARDGNC